MNLALNCLFFQCYNARILTAKLSPYYFIIQLTLYNRTISRFIAGDNIVYHRVRQEMRLASDNRRIGHSLKHLSWRSRWIILYTRWIIILCMRLVPFWLVLLTEHKVVHCSAMNAVYRCLVAGQLYPSCGFSSADCRCFQVSNPGRAIHSTAFVHHTALKDRDF